MLIGVQVIVIFTCVTCELASNSRWFKPTGWQEWTSLDHLMNHLKSGVENEERITITIQGFNLRSNFKSSK